MVNIDQALKDIYKNDIVPLVDGNINKELTLYFPNLLYTIGNDKIKGESFELYESICSDSDLVFGACEISQVNITVANVDVDLSGQIMVVTQFIDEYEMPLGTYIVKSCKKKDNLWFREIIAYDYMQKVDIDVADWYKGLFTTGSETYTLAAFRASLLTYVGITEDATNLPLPNDYMIVKKTIDPTQLPGLTVIKACEEINGCFGRINRENIFTHITLEKQHEDYPQNDYPQNDYPLAEPYNIEIGASSFQTIRFEEYTIKSIDKIIIRQDTDDLGCIYGTGSNPYIVMGNFLVYEKNALELITIAENLSQNIFHRAYRPYTAKTIGLPFVEPGDFVKFNSDDSTSGYILQRKLTGIQALRDEYVADGTEEQKQSFDSSFEIQQLKGKTIRITKDVEQFKVEVEDMDERLTGEINVMAGQVVLKVNSNGNIGYVSLNGNPDTDLTQIDVKADNINLEGLVTVNGNFKVLLDGTIEAINGKFSGNITASEYIGGVIRSANYYSGLSGMMIDLNNSTIDMINLYIDPTGKIRSNNGEFTTNGPNGSVTIKDGKITLKNTSLEATAEVDGSDMWIDYIIVKETANFIKRVNFQLETAPTLSIGGVSQTFITSANISGYLPSGGVTETQLINAMNAVDSTLRDWVSSNFVHQ